MARPFVHVLYGTSVRPPPPEAQAELDLVLHSWGSGRSLDTFAPSLAADPAARRITASLERAAASPAMIRHVIGALADSSAQGLLEGLRTPVLTHRAQVLAFVQLPVTAWRPGQGEQDLRAGLERCPSVAAALDNAALSGGVVGVRDLPTYFRRAAGAGWALVGDAAHHRDPLAARGIADALLGAELLTDYVLRGWDNDLDGALRAYAAELMRMLQPTALLNDQLAGLDLPAEQAHGTWQALQAAERQVYRPHHWRSNHDNAPGASASAVRRTSRPAGSGPR